MTDQCRWGCSIPDKCHLLVSRLWGKKVKVVQLSNEGSSRGKKKKSVVKLRPLMVTNQTHRGATILPLNSNRGLSCVIQSNTSFCSRGEIPFCKIGVVHIMNAGKSSRTMMKRRKKKKERYQKKKRQLFAIALYIIFFFFVQIKSASSS